MKLKIIRAAGFGGACLMAFTSHTAIAQTAGTIAAENRAEDDIIVTGQKLAGTGIEMSNSAKARAVVTQDYIAHTVPGQSIFNAINMVPGVNYVASDPYGGNGGTIRIRGFDQSRIAFTFDGLPLNDAGNYAIYSAQQVDPELVESVNVGFGSTDVDTPSASASGGTVNYRTIMPTDKVSAMGVYSHGRGNMNRVFGLINTGDLNQSGTRAWVAASNQRYDLFPFSIVRKSQYNARIYQPLGSGKDFVSLAGFFYQHRNTGYGNPSVAQINTILGNPFPIKTATAANPVRVDVTRQQYDQVLATGGFFNSNECTLASASPGAGSVQDDRRLCTNVRQINVNPVDTGNLRFNSLFTLSDHLTFTADGGYSYTLANGGGSNVFAESDANATQSGVSRNQFGRMGAGRAAGRDLNGDGDLLDYVRLFYPSNTQTHRLIAVAGLRYDIDAANLVRLAYTWDRARTRQTGEAGFLYPDGRPKSYFGGLGGGDAAVLDAAGAPLNKRNRLTYSILHQLSGEYRGRPIDDSLSLTIGLRAAFYRRNMSNACYTIPGSGSEAYCTSQSAQQVAADSRTAKFGPPYTGRIREYRAFLPNIGMVWQMVPALSLYASWNRGFSAPSTDIYSYDDKVISLKDKEAVPERTDSFDTGLRYTNGIVQAQLGGWFIRYDNRIVNVTVPLEGGGTISASRNVGRVDSKGIDATLSLTPTRWLSLYGFGSYLKSTLRDNVLNGDGSGTILIATKGKQLVDTPNWQYGTRAQITLPSLVLGVSAKHVGDRFITDENDAISAGYTLVDLDAQIGLGAVGLPKTYFQLNVTNLLDKRYYSNVWSAPRIANGGWLNFGNGRTVIGTLHFEF
ncbi:TonB-dependent receptor [Sphingomonas sanguinis]|jgi:iron complex outermembrane receptor protein|uniref:TonB-dependent receptor n=1 Tax=Sphingomonas sanguinis TaxID=33051 RepID=A0A7Y7QT74_9SPHN|nr:TonB-dependent receptor [Sphingomonas sanguinis]MBZ6380976.1 TonB-dependent receptor [Sphingomonas sanguinis]NNG49272.1 TonB-dependent receptor [Sphingomonas sanguinis]NNG55371.1 TonB-dependent receptor [Sphingomonas sanguinis]NVP30277.1 TonB-dependent receptor [Sphingomonas sanguinis]